MEYPLFNPDLEAFRRSYKLIWRDEPVFYLQGHPDAWDDRRFAEFTAIIRYLQAQGVRFVTPSQFLSIFLP